MRDSRTIRVIVRFAGSPRDSRSCAEIPQQGMKADLPTHPILPLCPNSVKARRLRSNCRDPSCHARSICAESPDSCPHDVEEASRSSPAMVGAVHGTKPHPPSLPKTFNQALAAEAFTRLVQGKPKLKQNHEMKQHCPRSRIDLGPYEKRATKRMTNMNDSRDPRNPYILMSC